MVNHQVFFVPSGLYDRQITRGLHVLDSDPGGETTFMMSLLVVDFWVLQIIRKVVGAELAQVHGRRGRLQLHWRRGLRRAWEGLWITLMGWLGVLVVMSTVIGSPAGRRAEFFNSSLKSYTPAVVWFDSCLESGGQGEPVWQHPVPWIVVNFLLSYSLLNTTRVYIFITWVTVIMCERVPGSPPPYFSLSPFRERSWERG